MGDDGWRVLRAGLVDYGAGLALQCALREAVALGHAPDTLILCEHPPVVTVGRAGMAADEPKGLALRGRGVGVHHVTRGGQTTYHGPGQLVGYPVVDLRRWGHGGGGSAPDLHAYVGGLEAALVAAVRGLGVSAQAMPGKRGIWVGERKLASIGVAVRGRVAYHGFALNVYCDPAPFSLIVPCGEPGGRVTSLCRELDRPVSMDVVASAVEEALTAWRHACRCSRPYAPAAEGAPAAWR